MNPVRESDDLPLDNDTNLQSFSKSVRVDFDFFKRILKEGIQIPIYLEELSELKSIYTKIEQWRERYDSIIQVPINGTEEEKSS